MKKLVFATNNSHKLEEVRALLRDVGSGIDEQYEILSLSDIGCDVDIPETGMTFYVNALQKANKDFELVVIPGKQHTMGETYGEHKRYDFFVRHLMGVEPPKWNELK